MLPFPTLIAIQRNTNVPVNLQIANAFISQIKKGLLPPGTRLPGTRMLAEELKVHRKTIVAAFEELLAQGWIETIPSRGTFVSRKLPESKPKELAQFDRAPSPLRQTGYPVTRNAALNVPVLGKNPGLRIDDGFPDVRLAPIEALSRAYRNVLKRGSARNLLTYSDIPGNAWLRAEISAYLNESRGLQTNPDNIMITRGSQMGIYLTTQVLIAAGDRVIVGDTNYWVADAGFRQAGANLLRVPVDEHGICVEAIEALCRKQPIRAVFVTPHHHHPTTVTLRADRRIRLLQLADTYRFAIIEDDYDYDFHYLSSPILPLASADTQGMVVYIGSLCKAIAPSIRIGYVAGPVNLIEELSRLRRIIDRQGDPILEQAVAELFREGEMKRHMKKALKAYHQRRDYFCQVLKANLGEVIDFRIPDGGMAIWARFHESLPLAAIAEEAAKKGLYLSNGKFYDPEDCSLNATPGLDLALDEAQFQAYKGQYDCGRLQDYIYRSKISQRHILCVDDARFINHSSQPNTLDTMEDVEGLTIASRDILPGEEITSDYQAFDADFSQYGHLLREVELLSASANGKAVLSGTTG